jgi:hypothetical protein
LQTTQSLSFSSPTVDQLRAFGDLPQQEPTTRSVNGTAGPCASLSRKQLRRPDMSTLLLIVLVLLLVGAIPAWPHSRGWGYGPSGLLGLVLVVVLVMALMNHAPI